MSTGSPHLDLAELLAEVNGEAVGERVGEHLAACPECRAEAEHWEAVAGGVRHLVAATTAPPWLPSGALAGAGEAPALPPRHRRLRTLAGAGGKPRRVLAAAAAAAVLVAGGVSYGLTRGLGGNGNGGAVTAAGLTAVNGCSGLDATSGTLEQVNGTSLVVKTPGGQRVRVSAPASTAVSREVTGSVSDITDGARVILHGTYAKGTIAARSVSIGVAPKLPTPGGGQPRPAHRRFPAPVWGQSAIAIGTVQNASDGSFTVTMPGGTRVPVATSGSTTVFTLASASVSQLQTGEYIVAVGSAGPSGTLAATTVEEGTSLPHIQHGNGISSLPRIGCSSSTVATAALVAAS
jgi:Domain of unknown function (DUF5666)